MNYLLITSIAFILVSYANFMTLIFRIRLNEKFLKNEKTLLTKKNSIIILFDLTTMEISKIDNSNKFFKINTY